MEKQKKKPLLPYVSIEGVENFEIDQPDTHCFSPLVNAVLEAFAIVHPISGVAVARFLDLSFPTLTGALKCETGLGYLEFYNYWLRRRVEKVVNERPDLTTEQIAHLLGFANRSSLWKFLYKHHLIREQHNSYYEPRNSLKEIWVGDKKHV